MFGIATFAIIAEAVGRLDTPTRAAKTVGLAGAAGLRADSPEVGNSPAPMATKSKDCPRTAGKA